MPTHRFLLLALLVALCACGQQPPQKAPKPVPAKPLPPYTESPAPEGGHKLATFAGGCFWCMEPPFEGRPGVISCISGYTGGPEQNPTYKQVAGGATGHTEAVQVAYDPKLISYRQLVEIFWRSMDPTDGGGQFADRGTQYRPGIFAHDDEQAAEAKASKQRLSDSGVFREPIVVPVETFEKFWPAEDYHQDYYKKEKSHYKRYRIGSGREGFLKKVWGDDAAGAKSRK